MSIFLPKFAPMKQMILIATLLLGLLTGCDRLDDGDDSVVQTVLPGAWAFSYTLESEEDTGLAFEYDHVTFREDGTVSIYYPDGSLEGTYTAGSAAIRIEGAVGGSSETRDMLWRILTFSNDLITAEYKFTLDGADITAIVTLERV